MINPSKDDWSYLFNIKKKMGGGYKPSEQELNEGGYVLSLCDNVG
jgi:hypothetical protein